MRKLAFCCIISVHGKNYPNILSAIVHDSKKFIAAFCPSVASFCAESHELYSVPTSWERLSNNYASSGSNTNFTGRQSGEEKATEKCETQKGIKRETKAREGGSEKGVLEWGKEGECKMRREAKGRKRGRSRECEAEGHHAWKFSLIFEPWDQRRWNTPQNSIKIQPGSLKLSVIIQETPRTARLSLFALCRIVHTQHTEPHTHDHWVVNKETYVASEHLSIRTDRSKDDVITALKVSWFTQVFNFDIWRFATHP